MWPFSRKKKAPEEFPDVVEAVSYDDGSEPLELPASEERNAWIKTGLYVLLAFGAAAGWSIHKKKSALPDGAAGSGAAPRSPPADFSGIPPATEAAIKAARDIPAFTLDGGVFDAATLKPVKGAVLVLEEKVEGKRFKTPSNRKGYFRAVLPDSADGFVVKVFVDGRERAADEDWIPSLRTVDSETRLGLFKEYRKRPPERLVVAPAGKRRRTLDLAVFGERVD